VFKKVIASLGAVILTVGVAVVGVTIPASATDGYPTGSAANQPANWQLLPDETCVDIQPVNTVPYVLPAAPDGRSYSKIVVKAGSESSVTEPNAVFLNPTPGGQGYKHPEKDSISHIILCTVPFDYDWQYSAPTCYALTVNYPADIPSGQANDVNVRIVYGVGYATELTLNFHNNAGTWSGTQAFTYSTHPNWPENIGPYKVVWTQVAGSNYHWQGEISCGSVIVPEDASASVSTTPPTCEAGEQLVLGTAINATWGPVIGAYSVTATANDGHLFPGGSTTQTFTGELEPALTCMEVALYVYKKLDPTKPAAWNNSGKQTLITTKLGNEWFDEESFPTLPTWVCGPAWGVQQDMTKDWDPAKWDLDSDGRFDWPTNITYPHDNIGWPPLYAAQHSDLSTYLDVPDCATTSGEPTFSSKSCQVDSQNLLTLPAVDGGEWTVTKGDTVLTYASYEGGPVDGFGTYTIELSDANPDDEFTVTPSQSSWEWTAVDPDDLDCATAEDPNWADQECNPDGPGTTVASYTIIPVTGVLYEVSLDDGATWTDATPPGIDPVVTVVGSFTTKVTIRAYPAPGYELVGPTETSHQFDAAVDCVDRDASAFIESAPATCFAAGSINELTKTATNATWITAMPSAPGSYDIVAQANDGHAFSTGELTLTFPITLAEQMPGDAPPCDFPTLASVYPQYSSTPLTCTAAGTYTIGALTPGTVKWSVNGGPLIDGGTFPVKASAVISLVASPTDPADTLATDDFDDPTWTNPVVLTFTAPDPASCNTELTTLALTGIGSGMGLSLAGGFLLLGLGGLFVFARTRQTGRHAE